MSEAEESQGFEMADRLVAVEARLRRLESQLPKSDIVSKAFWTRAWAVFGHLLAAGCMLLLILFGLLWLCS